MNLSRLGTGATLAAAILTVWMGACANSVEVCGVEGLNNGTCQVGPTCPSGSGLLIISNPFEMCPASNSPGGVDYVCCVPTPDAASSFNDASQTPDAPRSGMDATVTNDAKPSVDAGVDVTSPSNDTGVPDTTVPMVDTGAPDTGSGDTGTPDTGTACDGGTACTAASTCAAQTTSCVTNTCTTGCCGTANAASGTTCTDSGGAVCDGNGTCVECNVDGDCPTGGTCQSNKCTLKANGAACTTDAQCAGTHCAAGVCCNTACSGTCQACAAALTGGTDGTCANISNGTAAPAGQCTTSPPCGNDGNCVAGACEQAASGTACGAASCSLGVLTASAACDGTGTCGAGSSAPCPGGFVCASATACKSACGSNADCQAVGFVCQNPGASGTCVALEAPGSACVANDQCVSGVCDVAGTGNCCTAACIGGACGATRCDATGACVYPGNTVAPASLQTPGDCQKIVCNGSAGVTSVDDPTDLPTPNTVCEMNPACTGVPLEPSFTPAATGTSCTADNNPPKAVCGDTSNSLIAGTCVQCNTSSDCSGAEACVLNVCQ